MRCHENRVTFYSRAAAFRLELARDYPRDTAPQAYSERWILGPSVELATERWKFPEKSDLVDNITSACCSDEMENYWNSNADEAAYQAYKNFGFAHTIWGITQHKHYMNL